ncbi:hypothetical protein MASR1M59_25300 [Melaminivora sp.]
MSDPRTAAQEPPAKAPSAKPSLLRSLRAVAWSLLGVRGNAQYQRDLQSVQPLHVVLIGLIVLFAFVAGLMALVNWVV